MNGTSAFSPNLEVIQPTANLPVFPKKPLIGVKQLVPAIKSHGLEMVLVSVGTGERTEHFNIHKQILCIASKYFAAALSGNFRESYDNHLELQDEDPQAFKVLYHFLYTGKVHDASFYEHIHLPYDGLLARAFKLADAVMAYSFRAELYVRLHTLYTDTHFRSPSLGCVKALYETDVDLGPLQQYVTAHCGYWIKNDTSKDGRWKEWKCILDSNDEFRHQVNDWLVKALSKDVKYPGHHPIFDDAFLPKNVYQVPEEEAAAMKTEVGQQTVTATDSAQDANNGVAKRKIAKLRVSKRGSLHRGLSLTERLDMSSLTEGLDVNVPGSFPSHESQASSQYV